MAFWGRNDEGLYRGDPVPGMLPPANPETDDQWATPPGTGPWAHPPGTGPWATGTVGPSPAEPQQRPVPITVAGRLGTGFGIGILLLGAGYVALGIVWAITMFVGDDPAGRVWGMFMIVVVAIVGVFVLGIGFGFLKATKALNHHSGTPMFVMCGIAIVAGLGGTESVGLVLSYLPVPGISAVLRVAVVAIPATIIVLLMSSESAAWRKQPTDWRRAWRLF